MTGKTKVKIVFLGGQAVGKSSIIEKYIHDNFDETANVPMASCSLQWGLISWLRTSALRGATTDFSCGTPQGSSDSVH